MQLSLFICHCFCKDILNQMIKPNLRMCIVLVIDSKSHTYPYIYILIIHHVST